VTDFDGNPVAAERGAWQPAARDLAQLLTSLQNLAMIVARQRAGARLSEDLWEASGVWATTPAALERAAELRGELLRAYRARLAAAGRAELLDERLLRAFEVEQECRELLYSARFRPTWRYAGLGVLRSWYA
jgi:maltokinase